MNLVLELRDQPVRELALLDDRGLRSAHLVVFVERGLLQAANVAAVAPCVVLPHFDVFLRAVALLAAARCLEHFQVNLVAAHLLVFDVFMLRRGAVQSSAEPPRLNVERLAQKHLNVQNSLLQIGALFFVEHDRHRVVNVPELFAHGLKLAVDTRGGLRARDD